MRYFLGLLGVAVGVFLVIKTEWMVNNFGSIAWAEKYLGGGGTRTFYKLLGIIIIIISFLALTGLLGKVVLAIFGPLFGAYGEVPKYDI